MTYNRCSYSCWCRSMGLRVGQAVLCCFCTRRLQRGRSAYAKGWCWKEHQDVWQPASPVVVIVVVIVIVIVIVIVVAIVIVSFQYCRLLILWHKWCQTLSSYPKRATRACAFTCVDPTPGTLDLLVYGMHDIISCQDPRFSERPSVLHSQWQQPTQQQQC